MNKSDFLNKLNDKQKGYDYSLVDEQLSTKDVISVICHEKDELGREHGIFTNSCTHMIHRGDCCPKCNGKYMDKELFIHKSNQVHDKGQYDYSKFDFKDKNSTSTIHCNIHNIDFNQQAKKHLLGHGCPLCRYEKSGQNQRKTTEEFINQARIIHNDKYDYSQTEYITSNDKVKIICHEKDELGREHGVFEMLPLNHIHKTVPQGCPKCAITKNGLNKRKNFQDFEEQAKKIHENKYSYSHDYTLSNNKVSIVCPTHGEFLMTPSNHLQGQGCPTCGLVWTVPERTILAFFKEILGEEEIQIHTRKIIAPLELDIYIPRLKLAIEYNGLTWHSEKFKEEYKNAHLVKLKRCNELGIRLIQIFEDEWLNKKDIVLSRLKSILKIYDKTYYARQCKIIEISAKEANVFLNQNHLQGECPSRIRYGLIYDDELIAVMTFGSLRQMKKYNENYETIWELLRFACKLNCQIIGGASRLLKHFIKNNRPKKIVTYADKRWSIGSLYFKLDFQYTHDSQPNYFYVCGKERKNRFQFRKSNLVKQGFDKNKSEHEIMRERGLYRIYDCGTMVFVKIIEK